MGYGDLNEVLDKEESFLSNSSIDQQDFDLLLNDNFFDQM